MPPDAENLGPTQTRVDPSEMEKLQKNLRL